MPLDLANDRQRQQIEASVNRHIQLTNRKIETEKERVRIDEGFVVPRIGMMAQKLPEETSPLDLRPDANEYNPVRDLSRQENTIHSSAEMVQSEMADDQDFQAAQENYRQKSAKQFLENARRNGYDVKLDAEARVIEVHPIGGSAPGLPNSTTSDSEPFR